MDKNEQYFVQLLKSFLQSEVPPVCDDVDWNIIYSISRSQQVTAMIASSVMKLPPNRVKDKELYLAFVQNIGLETSRSDEKEKALKLALNSLINKKIKHLLVKGAVLKYYYPAPELRSSSDIDIIVDKNDYDNAISAIQSVGFEIVLRNANVTVLKFGNETFEIHSNSDTLLNYFENWQKIAKSNNGYTYKFTDTDHLLYVICHIIKHIGYGGLGIRMVADIFVLEHKGQIDYEYLFQTASKLGVLTPTKVLLAFSAKLFCTASSSDYNFDNNIDFYNDMCHLALKYNAYGITDSSGVIRLKNSIKEGKEATFLTSLKAFFGMFIISKEALKSQFEFCSKHPILLPLAYICRIFRSVFSHRKTTKKSISSIFTRSNEAEMLNNIIKTMKID